MLRNTTILLIGVTLGAAAPGWPTDVPGRVAFGFNVGGGGSTSDHERWSARGSGYAYFGEVAYEANSWLVAPVLQWGYAYTSGALPAWEAAGYGEGADGLRTEANDIFIGARVRVPLWRMKLRPYAGGGVLWADYHRKVLAGSFVRNDEESAGWGWAALGGIEFFPAPARGFSLCLEYRWANTDQEWRQLPTAASKGPFAPAFHLTEQLITAGVRLYTL